MTITTGELLQSTFNPEDTVAIATHHLKVLRQLIATGSFDPTNFPVKDSDGATVKTSGAPSWCAYDGPQKPAIVYIVESLTKALPLLEGKPLLKEQVQCILEALTLLGFTWEG